MGACFSLCMTFSIRARTSDGSISHYLVLSTVGYLIAAVGPFFLIGYLHDVTESWDSGYYCFDCKVVLFFYFWLSSVKNKVVEDH